MKRYGLFAAYGGMQIIFGDAIQECGGGLVKIYRTRDSELVLVAVISLAPGQRIEEDHATSTSTQH